MAISLPVYGQEYVPGEIIVKMKKSSSGAKTHKFLGKLGQKMALKKSFKRFNMHQFKLGAGLSVEKAVNDMLLDPDVEFAEPNYIFRKSSVGIEGEPMSFSEMNEVMADAGSLSSNSFNQTAADLRVEEAWGKLSNNNNKPVVAIIDSGVDYNHYVFADSGAIWSNTDEIPNNGVDDDGNGYVDDVHGWNFVNNSNNPMDDDNHGTHVAGIVLGMTQNILKANLDPAIIRIMPLKFLDNQGSGTTSDAIEAIHYAIENGAHVLNNSWGGGTFSQALLNAITVAYAQGKTFVAAAGNASNNNDAAPTYPATYDVPNIISIAATSSADNLASFSNFGNITVHVASPGISILSTLPNDSFGYSSGTSMAAPFVSGLAALLVREKGNINGYQVRGVLFDNSRGVSNLQGKVASQSRIDALQALEFVQANDIDSYQPEYTGARDIAASGGGAAGGCGMVAKVMNSTRNGGRPPGGTTLLMLGLLFAPVILITVLRIRRSNDIESRRKFPRYKLASEVRIDVGGKQLVGQMNSISLGGAGIDTDALLEKGGIVTLSIESPDGQNQIQVQGRVVWSEEKKSYGVQFCDAKDEAISAIGGWTKNLSKT